MPTPLGPKLNLEIDHAWGNVLLRLGGEKVLTVALTPRQAKVIARSMRRYARYAELCPDTGPAKDRVKK